VHNHVFNQGRQDERDLHTLNGLWLLAHFLPPLPCAMGTAITVGAVHLPEVPHSMHRGGEGPANQL